MGVRAAQPSGTGEQPRARSGGRLFPRHVRRRDGYFLGFKPIADAISDEQKKVLTSEQLRENGLAVHADVSEHSDVLFLRPELVADDYRKAPSVSGSTFEELQKIAERPDWTGYFGAPQFATAAQGARD